MSNKSKKETPGLSTSPDAVKIFRCGCCGCYHRMDYWGDCRNDEERFADPEDAEDRLGKPTLEVDM